ncbi:Cys-tRNA(Pro) deacylase [Janibacter cremeus]|uniref:Cys-tRNA(Pro)/Cys-tRNA(Cys) deacylase n=1 Tax=Janibacter cremeus TaxID=1285192 RepID=A0A852VXA3_9MICO|nr:Cys-tRNA(Pro) deacylase [Janibacter cremeus]NYF98405.1 Cys-tRNA(Pro)/Cys-tRNA(Cys) deacylase [Janibacter cremeus]
MARRAKGGGATPATRALVEAGVGYTEHPYEHDPAAQSYGLEAAEAIGAPPEQVYKTLLARTDLAANHGLVVGIVPVTGQLDLKALAAAVGAKKATMADPALAEKTTGYVVGGISPLGQKRALNTVLDDSALEHATIFVSGGRRGLDLELPPSDLVALTSATVAGIARA